MKSPLPNPLTNSSPFNRDPSSAGVVFTDLSSNGIVLKKLDYSSEATKFPMNDGDHESRVPDYSESGDGLYPHLHNDEEYWGRKNLLNGENKYNRVWWMCVLVLWSKSEN